MNDLNHERLIASLSHSPHDFLQPTLPLYTGCLAHLTHALDPLAAEVSSVQQQRLQEARKKRKRGQAVPETDVLRLRKVYVSDGFGLEQVWEQARRVIDAAADEAERGLEQYRAMHEVHGNGATDAAVGAFTADAEPQDGEDESLGEEGVDYEVEGPDFDGAELEELAGEAQFDQDNAAPLKRDRYMKRDDDNQFGADADEDESVGNEEPAEEFVTDKFGLNDGFFSIDDFNRRTDFLEQQDIRGEGDGAASDEEDVDWDADPSAEAAIKGGKDEARDGLIDDAEDDAEEDGPTFDDPDAPSESDDGELENGEADALGGIANTNAVMYADFFAPPAQKRRKKEKGRSRSQKFPELGINGRADDTEAALEQAMADVHRDLFEDEEAAGDEADERDELDPSDSRSRRSTHERRKAAIAEEIRKLEAANVAKREWTLSGEARAADRPLNSLLEEDLEFERTGKPVPVVTAEVSESIEDLIKRRILAHDFQDIIRRRPDDLATGREARRGRLDFELDDSKAKKGLAEEYEEEHLRRSDPNFVDAKDEKLKKEEKEIEALWSKIRSDLDSLSSWHFRPKQPAPQLDIRVDAPAISLEDARPSVGADVAAESQLAPQEVYKVGEATKGMKGEVAGKSGLPAGREELSRDERKRRRRREKERIRKATGSAGAKPVNGREKEKTDVISDLKKGNVKIIGKKGDVKDVDGREVKASGGQRGAGKYKL